MQTPAYILNPGELRHKVQIQKPSTATRDSAGQPGTTWDKVLDTRAKIESTGSIAYKQSFASNVLASQSTDMLTIRWPGASIVIKADMRIVFGTNIFLIQAIDNVEHRNRVLRLACLQIDADSN